MSEYKSVNPFDNEVYSTFEENSLSECFSIIKQLRLAQEEHSKSSLEIRAQNLLKLADLLERDADALAWIATEEMGKPLGEAVAEVKKCAWVCRYYAEQAPALLIDQKVDVQPHNARIKHAPLGAILAIMPWNFPYWQVFRVLAPNLMLGNGVVLKHAPNVTRCALAMEKLVEEAGFTPHLLSVIKPKTQDIQFIIESPLINGVTLTGSTAAGRAVASIAGQNLKKTVLELGGSNAFIVCADADLDQAIDMAMGGRFMNNGQSCIAAKRFIVHESLFDQFTSKMSDRIESLVVGDPREEGVNIGPLARVDLAEKLIAQAESSIASGACKALTPIKREGAVVYPMLMTCRDTTCQAWREETFGPLAILTPFVTLDQAVDLARASDYGLGLSVFTADPTSFDPFVSMVPDGAIFFNSFVKSDPRLPFGGTKASGYGRELSTQGLFEFANVQTIWFESHE